MLRHFIFSSRFVALVLGVRQTGKKKRHVTYDVSREDEFGMGYDLPSLLLLLSGLFVIESHKINTKIIDDSDLLPGKSFDAKSE